MLLTNNVFILNEAISEGGAIKWLDVEPEIDYSSNFFFNNSASYGSNNAGFPFRIEMAYDPLIENICLNNSLIECYQQIPNLSSGSELNLSLIFSIKDIYNVTVTSMNFEYYNFFIEFNFVY